MDTPDDELTDSIPESVDGAEPAETDTSHDATARLDEHDDDDVDEPRGPAPSLVRPYTLTAGRTASEVYLPLEAPVHTVSGAPSNSWPASDMRTRIVALCADGPSVAEISARLNIPLGVARVLVGDLVETGILRVSVTLGDDATADERRELIGRTLRGLRAL